MAEQTLTIRPFATDDLPQVLDLLRSSLGETALLQRTPELFNWKHVDNPFGRSIMLVAADGPTIAGFRAFMRWELLQPDGTTLRCVRAVDTATHPEYRRRGIFRSLTMAALDAATADGVDMVFNTPNPRSGAGYLTMGWSEVGVIRPLAFPARGLMRKRPDTAQLPEPADFVAQPEPVTPRSTPDRTLRGLRTPRTEEYHAWRFTGHPTARYVQFAAGTATAVGRIAHRGRLRELLISEVYGEHLGKAIHLAQRSATSSYVGAFFSKGSPERRATVRSGFVPVPGATMTLMCRPLRNLGDGIESLDSWDLSLSDLELL
ncbi:MAG: GNAT family N-acetyltransferase [Acidimicrobiia bacterium]|nr:GNAT family N-acetyltransferase [Acidimicrobiia bacterium]